MKRFIRYFKPHLKLFILDLIAATIVSAIDLLFPAVTRWCLYSLIPSGKWQTFWLVMASIFAFYIIRTLLTYVMWFYGHSFGVRVESDMRRDVFMHIQNQSFEFFDSSRTGDLLSRLTTDLFDITEMAHHAPEDLFISTITIIGSLAVMFSIEWRLATVIAITVPLFLLIVIKMRKNMHDVSVNVKRTTSGINTEYESEISGMRTTKSFGNEQIALKKFESSSGKFKNAKYKFYKAMGMFNSSMELFLCSMNAIIIAVGGWLIMKGGMNVVDLITFSLYISTFVSPVRRLAMTSEMIANGNAGLKRYEELMNIEPSIKEKPDAKELRNVKGEIELSNVSFEYKTGSEVLHNVSIKVNSGETIALVGPSGGGKTTIANLIPRFYDVTSGEVKIDGQNVKDLTLSSIHRNIGIISQDVFLFAASVKENIRYGRIDATDEEVADAAKKAEIYDDIMNMPNGFDTNVGERGVLLSGGQKQRIAIARIFLKNPPILILDEATSALDNRTEDRIQKTFDKLATNRTAIIIAHRLSTIRGATKIAVVENGKITESGAHEELMNKNGEYFRLVSLQE